MSLDTAIRLSAQVQGGGAIDRVKRSLQDLGKSGQTTRMDMVRLEVAARNYARVNDQTISGIRNSINAFRGLQEQAKIGSAQFKRYGDEISRLESKLRGLDGASQQAGKGLRQQLLSGIAAAGAGRVAGGAIQSTVANEESERRLRSLSQGLDDYRKVQETAAAAAAKFGLTQTQANQEFAQIYARLRPIGLTLEQVSTAYNGFNTAAKLSGTTSAEASAAFLQLSQALGTGVLRGEELNSVFEQTPAVVQAIAQEMGVPIGQIRELAKQGQITSDIVLRALARIETEGAPKLAEAMKGPAQQFKNLQIEGERLQRELGEAMLPIVLALTKGLTGMLQESNKLPEPIKQVGAAAAAAGLAVGSMTLAINAIGGISAATAALKAYTASAGAAAAASTTAATAATGLGAASGAAATSAGMLLGALTKIGKIGLIVIGVKFAIEGLDELITGLIGVRDAEASARAMAERRGLTYVPSAAVQRRNAAASDYVSPFAGARDRAFALAQQIQPAAGAAAGGGGGGGRGATGASGFQPSSRARALIAAAQKLGVSPLDLATIISFETGGTFSPSKWGGAGGNYMGLIQFGAPERRQYGANANQSFEQQVTGPVVRYFQDRFKGVGMSTQGASLEDLYTTVLAGNPRANRNSRDSFGTSPRSGVAAMGPHRQKALQMFFGGSMANVGFGAMEQAEASNAGFEAQQQAADELAQKQESITKSLKEFVEQRVEAVIQATKESELLQATTDEERRRIEYEYEKNNIADRYNKLRAEANRLAEEASAVGVENNNQEQIAQINAEESQALANAQLKLEQDLNKIYEERAVLMREIRNAAAMPTVYNELETQKVVLDEILQKYPAIGGAADAAANLATRGMAELVAGTKNAKEVFVDFLNGIANALIEAAQKMIAQYIAIGIAKMFAGLGSSTGGFQGSNTGPFTSGNVGSFGFDPGAMLNGPAFAPRALGGPVAAGRPYPVGERGPELFVPYQSGTIVPSDEMQTILSPAVGGIRRLPQGVSNMMVPFQRNAAGSAALSVPFQRGGDSNGDGVDGSNTIDVKFETVRIGEMDFVTRDEAQKMSRQAANQGAEIAQRRIKNNPTIRRNLGMA